MKPAFLFLLFSVILTNFLFAQEKVTGIVLDEKEAPISYATITLHALTGDSILAFAFTDAEGIFAADLPTLNRFEVRANSLGKKPDTIFVAQPFDFPLRFLLIPSTNKLPGVTVKTDRKPVVEKGDTTTYGVGQFQESEDDRVEEILRKIPGIEVKEDGSINVRGKPLHRILIEGSDLFGKDYQLGSKNIRAKDIATIEEIDHYQENLVLKTVNKSEAIVLNLKLKEEAKSVVSGTITPGLGYGEELKYHEYASIFKVSKKHKTIFIGNLDNVAAGFGASSVDVTYNNSDAFDLRRNANEPWRLIGNNTIDHLGLKSVYTDNARTLFTTIRHETDLSRRWKLNVNGVYGSTNRAQNQRREQAYLIDPESFSFQEVNDWSNKSRYFSPEIELSYLDAAQKTSLDLFVKTSGEDFSQLENRLINNDKTSEDREDTYRNTSARALLSRQFKPGLVGLLEFSTGKLYDNLTASLNNSPIPSLLGFEDANGSNVFNQSLRLKKQAVSLKPTVLYRIGQSILEWNVAVENRRLEGSHNPSTEQQNAILPGENQEVEIANYTSTLQVKFPVANNSTVRSSVTAGFNDYSYLAGNLVYPYAIRGIYESNRPNGDVLRISATRENAAPSDAQHLFNLPYVTSVRTLTLPGEAPVLSTNTKLDVFLGKKNDLQLSNLQFRLSASLTANANFNSFAFDGNSLTSSLTNGRNQQRASAGVRYDKFVSTVRSNLILGYSTTYSATDFIIEDQSIAIESWENNFSAAVNSLISRKFRIKGGSRLVLTSLPSGTSNGSVILSNLKTELELIFADGLSKYFVGASNALTGIENRSNSLYATYLGIKKEVKRKHRTIILDLRVYNLNNRGDFSLFDSDTVFENRSVTPAIGTFFLFKVDYGL